MTLWHSSSADRPSSRTLVVSLLLHLVLITMLLTVRSLEPTHLRSAPVILIASPYRASPPVKVRPARIERSAKITRTFLVPDRPPQRTAPPKSQVAAPEPPSFRPAEIPLLPAAILDLPPVPLPVRRTPAATGAFDSATPSKQAFTRTEVTAGTFGDSSVAAAGPRTSKSAVSVSFSAAEILSKPRPVYTEEARRLQIEGEVLLEVLFGASGDARVLRMIRGLGHGLDETAISAAREIRFRPARRDGTAVDSSVVVRIVFQLAF